MSKQSLLEFVDQFGSVMISTLGTNNVPHASYAPQVRIEDDFYIIVSEAAEHYHNLTNASRASILFIENEEQAASIFFRKRMTLKVEADETKEESVIKALQEKHGDMVARLMQMDFHIFKLCPIKGIYVLGPGQAYPVSSTLDVSEQAISGGHGKKK